MGKIIKNAVVIFLFLILIVFTASLAYLHFFASSDKDFSGVWTAELDMTEEAAVTALSWLQDIEAVSISLEDMESYMQDLTVQVELTFEQTSGAGGTFQCNVLPESYEACNQAAYEAFARAFQELLTRRLHMAGYTDRIDEEVIEDLVTETFGMSTVAYLMSYGPDLLPSLENLQMQYGGSGTYEVTEDILTRWFEDGGAVTARAESYIRKESLLVLSGTADFAGSDIYSDFYPIIYTLK